MCKTVLRLFSIVLLGLSWMAHAQGGSTEAEKREAFQQLLDGARLEGKFSVVGADGQMMQREDLYAISRLRPGDGDTWVFEYEMSYGDNLGQTLEIPVRVVFAEDTPVLTMSEQEVPGLGNFSVRLVFYEDYYAGMWSNGPIGGHMWGTIRRDTADPE